ncbi:MAG: ATP-binding cassette domain-containing protein [Deltaproteobacteria bacterium]|nr:MAG: ATP-binding cassette domain-containing protein [Deltaproteobacteria bacterium]
MKAIEIKDLNFTYRNSEQKAIDSVCLSQSEGELIAIMGSTGAGKSSLIRCLNRIIPNFFKGDLTGEIKIFETDITREKVTRMIDRVGMVFQDFETQLFSTSAFLEVAFGPENLGVNREEIKRRIGDSLEKIRLAGYEDREPSSLSGGEKQRLAIASILSIRPRIMVLDEPTTDLDPIGKQEIFQALKDLREQGLTVVLVEHETEEIGDVDRIIIIRDGRIIEEGKSSDILSRINILKDNGIRPPQLVKLFHDLNIPCPTWPLHVNQAFFAMKSNNKRLSDDKYFTLCQGDKEKEEDYGKEIIRVDDLVHTYPTGQQALAGVNLSIKEREFIAIIGQNGSGKTTLVKHLNGLLRPTRGKVYYESTDIDDKKVSSLGKQIGYVFQNPDHQIFSPTVGEEIAFGPRNYGFSEQQTKTKVEQALKVVGLEGYHDKDPFLLTKGERQRVAIASIIVSEPRVIILDEPTTGLDYNEQVRIMELLTDLNTQGHTLIIITHSMWVVAEYTHRVLVLSDGKILADDTTRKVFCNEAILKESALKLPEIIQLGLQFNKTILSLNEFKFCLEDGLA